MADERYAALAPCAILIPSLNRSQYLRRVVENIHASTPEPHRIRFCVGEPASKAILDELGEWYLDDTDDPDKRYVTRMNKLVRQLDDEQTVFFGSDDVIHHPGWLREAWKVMAQGPAVVVVNDLHNANGTQAVMKVDYLPYAVVDSPGDAFHAGYQHNFADNEQFVTAAAHDVIARAPLSMVEHLHPLFQSHNSVPWDSTYRDAMHGWERDQALFAQRLALIESYADR